MSTRRCTRTTSATTPAKPRVVVLTDARKKSEPRDSRGMEPDEPESGNTQKGL